MRSVMQQTQSGVTRPSSQKIQLLRGTLSHGELQSIAAVIVGQDCRCSFIGLESDTTVSPDLFIHHNSQEKVFRFEMVALLPDDLLHMICGVLWEQRDFDTLYHCACAGKQLAYPALANLYRSVLCLFSAVHVDFAISKTEEDQHA